jgi:hypothetical protein
VSGGETSFGGFDGEHRPGQEAGIGWRMVAGGGEALVPGAPLADDRLGRAAVQDAPAAAVVGAVEADQQPRQLAVAGDGEAQHQLAPHPAGR